MIPNLATLTLALATASAPELHSAVELPSADRLQIHAATVLVGDGTVLKDVLVVVQDGKIASVQAGAQPNPEQPLLEHAGVLTAGIVAGPTTSGAAGEAFESVRSMLPGAKMAHAFAPGHSDFGKALAAGITSLVLAPSANNVVGGLTCVVKSHGGALVAPEAQLALSFSAGALAQGPPQVSFFFGSAEAERQVPLAADGGPENTERSTTGARYPTSYPGAVKALNDEFAAGAGAIERAKRGELSVLIEAWDRNEVARALRFAMAHGLKGALRGAPLAADPALLARVQESKLGVVVGPFEAGQRRRSLEGVAALQKAGVPVAFALDAPANHPEGVRLSAAMAIAAGADADLVWKALTGDAAKLAGVDSRIGLVAPGRDADLVLWSGHPLDLTSRIEAVWVDGARVDQGGAR